MKWAFFKQTGTQHTHLISWPFFEASQPILHGSKIGLHIPKAKHLIKQASRCQKA
jgi:hypothetical protein